MGLSQALSAALAGVNVDPAKPLGDRRERGERQHARLRRRERQSESRSALPANPAPASTPPASTAISNTLLQSQLWTETSGGSYADTTSQLYQQLQQVYGTPGSSTSFDAIYNNFTTALQSLATNPGSYSEQSAVVGAAQAAGAKSQFDDDEHPAAAHRGRAGHRQRRANGEHRAAADRPDQSAAPGSVPPPTAPRRRSRTSATRTSLSCPS